MEQAPTSRYQTFRTEEVDRRQIKEAPYNPRIIDQYAEKQLEDKIKEVGLVEALVWNKRTGNLVSGHQRLKILDRLERKKDYKLTVCVIDVDEEKEKILNVFLNNPNVMGSYDIIKLENLLKEAADIKVEDYGFTDIDLANLGVDLKGFFDEHNPDVLDAISKFEDFRQAHKKTNERIKDVMNEDSYIYIVFKNAKEVDEFLRLVQLPIENRCIDGSRLKSKVELYIKGVRDNPIP